MWPVLENNYSKATGVYPRHNWKVFDCGYCLAGVVFSGNRPARRPRSHTMEITRVKI